MGLAHLPRLAPLLGLAAVWAVQAGTLDVDLANLRPTGHVRVELYSDAKSWDEGRPLVSQVLAARDTSLTVRFDGLAVGRYAVRARQRALGEEGTSPGAPPLLQLLLPRWGTSGNKLDQNTPFSAAAVEVRGDPHLRVRMFTSSVY